MSETDLVVRAQYHLAGIGAWSCKTHGGTWGRAGIPDLLICHQGHFYGLEAKLPKGRISKLQEWELSRIRDAGGTAGTFRSITELKELLP